MRHQQILGVAAIVFGEANPLRRFTELFVSGHARTADPAAPAAVNRHRIAFLDRANARPYRRDASGILMSQRDRQAGQHANLPIDHVNVAVTEASAVNFNEDGPVRGRHWHVVDDQTFAIRV